MSRSVQKEVNQSSESVEVLDTTVPKTGVFLKFGYQDKETPDQFHKHVGFGKRPTAADFIRAAEECGGSDLQFTLGLIQSAITEFGQMAMPMPMTVLLSLNQIDREILANAYFGFMGESGGEILDDGKVQLAVGIERGGKKIVDFEFGNLLTGYDEIAIESEAKTVWQGNVLRMAKEISAPKDVSVAEIESLDVDDFTLLRNAEEKWLDSFRGE